MNNTHHITVVKSGKQYFAECGQLTVTTDGSAMLASQQLMQALTVGAHQASSYFLVDKTPAKKLMGEDEYTTFAGPWQFVAYIVCRKCKKRDFDNAKGCQVPTENSDGTWQCNRYVIQRVI